ncbi:MAG: hypothetical protein HN964_01735 [Candidatus Jacksonbacteria bacterium]|jgi:hypothetical protein|nr:hypothetical protein [Candidatus Jacksonbacteria bacterium]
MAPQNDDRYEDMINVTKDQRKWLVSIKPKNTTDSDAEWIMVSCLYGEDHALAHYYSDWYDERIADGTFEHKLPESEDPGGWARTDYGEAGEHSYSSFSGWHIDFSEAFSRFTSHITSRTWDPDQLGRFGQWCKEAGLYPHRIPLVLKEHLED